MAQLFYAGTRVKWKLGNKRQLRISHPAKEGKWMKDVWGNEEFPDSIHIMKGIA